jgi:restriction endonuclease Mrr
MSLADGFEHIGMTSTPQWMLDQGDEREIFISTSEIPDELADMTEIEIMAEYAEHRAQLLASIRERIHTMDNAQLERIVSVSAEVSHA